MPTSSYKQIIDEITRLELCVFDDLLAYPGLLIHTFRCEKQDICSIYMKVVSLMLSSRFNTKKVFSYMDYLAPIKIESQL